jgi:hypothetical protein
VGSPAGPAGEGAVHRDGDIADGEDLRVPDHLLAGVVADAAAGGVQAGHGHAAELRVAEAGREGPKRIGDVAGVQPAGRHLVQQRLEGVVQVPVQQHVDVRAVELPDR